MNEIFDARLSAYLGLAQELVTTGWGGHPGCPVLSCIQGKRYVRIVMTQQYGDWSRSAWAFVEIATGDILKAASWASPAKHARGSIYSEDPVANHSALGPLDLTRGAAKQRRSVRGTS